MKTEKDIRLAYKMSTGYLAPDCTPYQGRSMGEDEVLDTIAYIEWLEENYLALMKRPNLHFSPKDVQALAEAIINPPESTEELKKAALFLKKQLNERL